MFFSFSIPKVVSGEMECGTEREQSVMPSAASSVKHHVSSECQEGRTEASSKGYCVFCLRSWALAKAPPSSKIQVCGVWASRHDRSDLLWGWCSCALSRDLLTAGVLAFGLGAAWLQLWFCKQQRAVQCVSSVLVHRHESCLCILTASCTFLLFSRSQCAFDDFPFFETLK